MSKILANLTTRQRITILVVAIAVGAGLYSMVQWKKEGDFRPLFTGVSPEDAASIVQKLKESGAEYRLPEGGGSVLVPSARLAELRLTMASSVFASQPAWVSAFDKVNLSARNSPKRCYRRAWKANWSGP
jgi:flagellar M-ring protein FliF